MMPSRNMVVAPEGDIRGHRPIGAHRSGNLQPAGNVKAT